jgi:hypothetical protein
MTIGGFPVGMVTLVGLLITDQIFEWGDPGTNQKLDMVDLAVSAGGVLLYTGVMMLISVQKPPEGTCWLPQMVINGKTFREQGQVSYNLHDKQAFGIEMIAVICVAMTSGLVASGVSWIGFFKMSGLQARACVRIGTIPIFMYKSNLLRARLLNKEVKRPFPLVSDPTGLSFAPRTKKVEKAREKKAEKKAEKAKK